MDSHSNYARTLQSAAEKLGLDAAEQKIEKLLAYHQLLNKWNKAYNLTAVRDEREMIHRHLVDSLTIIPHLSGRKLLDVGCGGGLPGLVIAIMCPERQVALLDSNGKKTRFCTQVKVELQLANVSVLHTRLEQYQPEQKHDCITSRAFASLKDMVEKSAACCETGGIYLAMKGQYPEQELSELPDSVELLGVQALQVPGNQGERHLVSLRQK